MEDQLISFTTAKLAKEKGFDPQWNEFYNAIIYRCNDNFENAHITEELVGNIGIREFLAPTQSLLQKWLREVHNIHIWVNIDALNPTDVFYGNVCSLNVNDSDNNVTYNTYEEALEECLIESLKLIIK